MEKVDEETLGSSAPPTYTSHKVLQEGGVVDVHRRQHTRIPHTVRESAKATHFRLTNPRSSQSFTRTCVKGQPLICENQVQENLIVSVLTRSTKSQPSYRITDPDPWFNTGSWGIGSPRGTDPFKLRSRLLFLP